MEQYRRNVGSGSVNGYIPGIFASAFVTALLVSASIVSLHATWARGAVRVAESWGAAVGM